MFKHILLPTDGSELSESSILHGMQFAHSIHARVTGVYVMPEFDVMTIHPEMLSDTKEQYEKECKIHADMHLASFVSAAQGAGVVCETVTATNNHPYEAIIQVAEGNGCDLILMASHGRRGVKSLLLGSETQKVLTHTKIPVLVYR